MVLDLLLIGGTVALDPLPLTAFIVVLSSERGVRKGAAFAFGWLASLGVVVAVTVLATGNRPPEPNTAPSLAALAVKIAIGAGLVVFAVRRRHRMGEPRHRKPPKWQANVNGMSPWFALGLAPLLQPWGLIAAGAATVVEAKLSTWESYLALIAFCLLASASYLALLGYAAFRPGPGRAVLARFSAWIGAHTDQAIVAGALILGFWLIANSVYLIFSLPPPA